VTASAWIAADWPAPDKIKAGTTTRLGGVSKNSFASLNLAMHVNDETAAVEQNRDKLKMMLELPSEPRWLDQVHGCDVATDNNLLTKADAAVTATANTVCAVLTADCLPVLICDRDATCVAAVHAGWRGLAAGVVTSTIRKMPVAVDQLLVWLGPAIGPDAFEVGDDVRDAFMQLGQSFSDAFEQRENGKWLLDIYRAARIQLQQAGIEAVYGGGFCTFSDAERFYSYRREKTTGRMASLIWKTA